MTAHHAFRKLKLTAMLAAMLAAPLLLPIAIAALFFYGWSTP